VSRAHYDSHQNAVDDPGYRRFLARLAAPFLQRLAPGSRVLDYGCGPGPALARMLGDAGHDVRVYDPLYRPDTAVLETTYDAITCSEVAEHFEAPMEEFVRLRGLLRPGGLLGIMTCFQTDDARFADWHYRRDPTHVVFYKEATLRHVAAVLGLAIEVPQKDVAILQKPSSP
jgi:2-polyprenyl-3-methyl-5-hydroxy-6-metoxy-1,4-benzoquinol methylase